MNATQRFIQGYSLVSDETPSVNATQRFIQGYSLVSDETPSVNATQRFIQGYSLVSDETPSVNATQRFIQGYSLGREWGETMCINKKKFYNTCIYNLYHGTFKLSNQIVQFAVNIFHTHLLGGE